MQYSKMLHSKANITAKPSESPGSWLSLKAGLVTKIDSGFYAFSPMGQRVANKIEAIVRRNMDRSGALEVTLPSLHPYHLHEQSGRIAKFGNLMFTAEDSAGRKYCLAPSQEEVAMIFVASQLQSGRQLPIIIYQIAPKFRDNKPLMGLVRSREFLMLDTYSFDANPEGMTVSHVLVSGAYRKIISDVGLKHWQVATMGHQGMGNNATVFAIQSKYGKNRIYSCEPCGINLKPSRAVKGDSPGCPLCKRPMSLTHTLNLGEVADHGTAYSEPLKITFKDDSGAKHNLLGTGSCLSLPRIMIAIIEQNNDQKGIVWPVQVAPFEYVIIPIDYEDNSATTASAKLYSMMRAEGKNVIFDDRNIPIIRKFKEADLVGFPYKIVVSPKTLEQGQVEVQSRANGFKVFMSPDALRSVNHEELGKLNPK